MKFDLKNKIVRINILIGILVLVAFVEGLTFFYPGHAGSSFGQPVLAYRFFKLVSPYTHFDKIILTRTGCLGGGCREYETTIYGDGKVEYSGTMHVVTLGKATAKLSPEQIRDIAAAIPSDFFSLPERTFDCGQYDGGDTEVAVDIDEKSNTSKGCPANGELEIFTDAIDEIVGTEKWVGTEDEQRKMPDAFT